MAPFGAAGLAGLYIIFLAAAGNLSGHSGGDSKLVHMVFGEFGRLPCVCDLKVVWSSGLFRDDSVQGILISDDFGRVPKCSMIQCEVPVEGSMIIWESNVVCPRRSRARFCVALVQRFDALQEGGVRDPLA